MGAVSVNKRGACYCFATDLGSGGGEGQIRECCYGYFLAIGLGSGGGEGQIRECCYGYFLAIGLGSGASEVHVAALVRSRSKTVG